MLLHICEGLMVPTVMPQLQELKMQRHQQKGAQNAFQGIFKGVMRVAEGQLCARSCFFLVLVRHPTMAGRVVGFRYQCYVGLVCNSLWAGPV